MYLRNKLKGIELIINTGYVFTDTEIKYWLKERRLVLKQLLERQLEKFSRYDQ